jgi:hypothetical protein
LRSIGTPAFIQCYFEQKQCDERPMKKMGQDVCHIPRAREASGSIRRISIAGRIADDSPMRSSRQKPAVLFEEIFVNTDSGANRPSRRMGVADVQTRGMAGLRCAKGDDFTADFLEHVRRICW